MKLCGVRAHGRFGALADGLYAKFAAISRASIDQPGNLSHTYVPTGFRDALATCDRRYATCPDPSLEVSSDKARNRQLAAGTIGTSFSWLLIQLSPCSLLYPFDLERRLACIRLKFCCEPYSRHAHDFSSAQHHGRSLA